MLFDNAVQDTGIIQAISQAPQTISSRAMVEKQQKLVDGGLKDPAVESLSSFIGLPPRRWFTSTSITFANGGKADTGRPSFRPTLGLT